MTSQSTETIYRCALNKETPYSVYFGEQSRDLGYRIQQVERVLENLEPFYKKVQITIMDDRPLLYRVQGHQIFIGRQLLEAPGHLEKGLAKIWYRERNQTLFAQQNLLEEVMSDFLVYLANGDLDIGDPNTHIATALRRIKWPYIIKSVTSYCESPWKQSEHFGVCQNVKESEEELASQVTEMSLRPLLVSNWIFSYLELSMKERYEFTKNLPSFIRSDHTSSLPVTSEIPVGLTNTTLVRSIEAVRNVSLFISSSNVRSESGAHRNFLINLANELRLSGFQDAFAQVSFDVVFVSTDPVTESSKIFQDFQKIAEDHPKMQLAL
ncbi:MAG TPA: hypothetical protein VN132_10745, partial [Bdellovibrio sp.]|nr:hypothetical protein [Bdellovibrio sp.]